MRKLVTGFIAGTLVTLLAMLAILGGRNDDPAPSGGSEDRPTPAGFVNSVAEEVERRRQAALAAASRTAADASGSGGRGVQPGDEALRTDDSGSADCCPVAVISVPGESSKLEDSVAIPFLVESAPGLELTRPFLTGKWEGVMTGVGEQPDGSPTAVPPFDPARGQYGFRLDIRQTNLVMYFQNGDQWISLGEGQDLRTNEQGRSAVVFTALSAANGGIEAMMLNIVRWDEDTIAVHLSRVTGPGPRGDSLPPPVNSMGLLNRAQF